MSYASRLTGRKHTKAHVVLTICVCEENAGESKAQEQMSAREVEIVYTFDHVSIYGSTLIALFKDRMASFEVTADAEGLLRECRRAFIQAVAMHGTDQCRHMGRFGEGQGSVCEPSGSDTWDGEACLKEAKA